MYRPKMIDIFMGEQFWALKPRLKLVMTDSHFAPAALVSFAAKAARSGYYHRSKLSGQPIGLQV